MVFLGGISETGRYYVAYVYAIEVFPKRLQSNAGISIFLVFGCCKVMICLYFMLSSSKEWKVLAYTGISFAVLSLLITVIKLPESPRFLFSKRRFSQAEKVLKSIQLSNRKNPAYMFSLSEVSLSKVENIADKATGHLEEENLQGKFSELFKIKKYCINISIMVFTWMFGSFAFFMVPFYLQNIKANIFYLSLATESAELAASVAVLFVTRIMPLKKAI